jgi:pimeloyl-ACP methyl ester carboxylesterase
MADPLSNDRFIAGEERWAPFTGGHRMRYLFLKAQRNTGLRPVIFIHGFFGCSFSWRFNLEEFSRERDCYAIDLLGIGDSDHPPRGIYSYSFPDSARRVLDWIRQLGLTNVDLVATSHGGAVAMFMAVLDRQEHRNTVGRLVLVAPANPYSRRGRKRIWFFNTGFGSWLLKSTGGIDRIKDLSLDFMYGDRKLITPATRAGYGRVVEHPQAFDYALDVIRTWHTDMDKLLTELDTISDIPTLLLWGDRDHTVPTKTAIALQKHFRNSQLVTQRKAGHMPYEEDPKVFNHTVLDWLNRASAKAGA